VKERFRGMGGESRVGRRLAEEEKLLTCSGASPCAGLTGGPCSAKRYNERPDPICFPLFSRVTKLHTFSLAVLMVILPIVA